MSKVTAKSLAEKHKLLTVSEVHALQSVKDLLPSDPVIVNIGAGAGTSALAFLEMAPDAWLTTVDRDEDAVRKEYNALQDSGLDLKRYTVIISDSIETAKVWPDKGIDLLFMDGAHHYDYVKQEINSWASFVNPGGFIFIHDCGVGNHAWEQVKRAVDEWRETEQIELYKRERILAAVRIPSWGRGLKRNEIPYYVDLLHNNKPFGLARYGDGEWLAILGEIGRKNSNGCTFTQELCDALRGVLRNNLPYEHSILRIARDRLGARIGKFLGETDCEVEWTIGNTVADASTSGKLWPLIAHLRQRKILYVGPKYLRDINKVFFKYMAYVEVPPIDAYKDRVRIIQEIMEAVERGADFIGFSSGHHTHIFIDAIWQKIRNRISFIDFGSVWDGYLGVKSRKFIRSEQYNWKELLMKNTRGKKP